MNRPHGRTKKEEMEKREKMIAAYVDAYNRFEVAQMLADFDENIRFENMVDGEVTLVLEGIEQFREQALATTQLFSERTQTIRSFTHRENETEVEISYHAVLAKELPGGFQPGDHLSLEGRSVFTFSGDKITTLTDIH